MIISFPKYKVIELIRKILSYSFFFDPHLSGYNPGPHLLLMGNNGIYLLGNGMDKFGTKQIFSSDVIYSLEANPIVHQSFMVTFITK